MHTDNRGFALPIVLLCISLIILLTKNLQKDLFTYLEHSQTSLRASSTRRLLYKEELKFENNNKKLVCQNFADKEISSIYENCAIFTENSYFLDYKYNLEYELLECKNPSQAKEASGLIAEQDCELDSLSLNKNTSIKYNLKVNTLILEKEAANLEILGGLEVFKLYLKNSTTIKTTANLIINELFSAEEVNLDLISASGKIQINNSNNLISLRCQSQENLESTTLQYCQTSNNLLPHIDFLVQSWQRFVE